MRAGTAARYGVRGGADVDARGLEAALRRALPSDTVHFDAGARAMYATDASNYRQVPIGVVFPRSSDDVLATLDACRRFGSPVLTRGGGTSLAGQTCNAAVVLDCSRHFNRIVELDPDRRIARVQPGVVLDDLRRAAERHHLTFGPDPATHNRCTLGGMIGNNSCGVHSITAGLTSDNVEQLDIVTYDGLRLRVGATSEDELARIVAGGGRRAEIYAALHALIERDAEVIRRGFPDIPRRVSGYNLPDLLPGRGFHVGRALVGSEGTCVAVLESTLRLVEHPPARALVVLGYPDIYAAAEAVPEIMSFGPVGLEGFDDRLLEDEVAKRLNPAGVALLPPGRGWLLVEFAGWTPAEARDAAERLLHRITKGQSAPSAVLLEDAAEQHALWAVRESSLGATARAPGKPDTWPGWEDSAVAPDKFAPYLRDLRALMDRYGYIGAFYGHFGQGCLHTRMDYDLTTAAGIANFERFIHEAAELVVSYGGSLSGEHGDGQARGELLPIMFGPELMRVFREFKAIWDPGNHMNPGKLIDAARADQHLRLGTSYTPKRVRTTFKYPDDDGSFARAAMRCVGVGKCRREDGGVMCPSYMATREERYSTRGRARLLWEMLEGERGVIRHGWRDPHVKDALDLCLACKGCKGECPVRVDMATYKAEFLAHYYRGRLRPPAAYTMGLIFWWARLASHAPRLANFATHWPPLAALAKRLLGIAPQRTFPTFAPITFKQAFRRREEGRRMNPRRDRGIEMPAHEGRRMNPRLGAFGHEARLRGLEIEEREQHEFAAPPRLAEGAPHAPLHTPDASTHASPSRPPLPSASSASSAVPPSSPASVPSVSSVVSLSLSPRSPRSSASSAFTVPSPVILWPDTFNNHFHPEVALAAVEVLEAAGYRVIVPKAALCCGRPLYDWGMLDTAKRLLRRILDTLRDEIRAGVPLVCLEPSCVSVFRDELVELFPDDEDARRLSAQTFLLAELLERTPGFELPKLACSALVQGHCHHKAVLGGMGAEERLLRRMGVAATVPDSGCCGMAGAFGFERAHYDVSLACGERVLLPAVRTAAPETAILADGFSCAEQIAQTTHRRAIHLAQLLRLAYRAEAGETHPAGTPPEVACAALDELPVLRWHERGFARLALGAVVAGGLAALGAVAWRARRARRGRSRPMARGRRGVCGR